MRISNKKVINAMAELIKENLCFNDFKRYYQEFSRELDYNIYQYGNLDVYDYDLFQRLQAFGVTQKSVTEFEKVLDWDCTYKHRENIRNTYKLLVRHATQFLINEIRQNKLNENDFLQ
jgi:hypothetical protein